MKENFFSAIEKITQKDPRYKPEAYEFMMKALFYTQKSMKRHVHISGKELLQGIKEYCFEQFGPMTKEVLTHWGIHQTVDFGNIVFNMVDAGLMRKTEEDKIEDFKDIYEFNDVFEEGYRRRLEKDLRKILKKKE
ncbi:MAG: Minf_1886 family protein [Candidatus Omnitrophota bacterium]